MNSMIGSHSNATMITLGNSKPCKSPDFMNQSHTGLGSRGGSRALDSTHETIKTRMTDTRRTASSNNLSASFNTLENYVGNLRISRIS